MSLCTVFDSISSNIDEVVSIDPSANVFVFGDFNVHLKDWLTYSDGTDRPGELCYNFSISNDLTKMVNFPTWIPYCDSHTVMVLLFFISFFSCNYLFYSCFPSVGKYDHFVVLWDVLFHLIDYDFSSSQRDVPFHLIDYDFSSADWDGRCDHLRDIPWEDILKLSASAAASELCEWVHVGIDVSLIENIR